MAIPPPKDIDYDEWIKAQTLAENAWRATIPGMLVLLVGQLWLIRSLILHFPVISAIASGIRTISGIFFAIGFCFGVLALIYHPDRSNDRLYVLKAVVAIAALPVLIVVMWIVWPLIIANVGGDGAMKSIEAPHLMDPAWIKAEKFAALALKGTAWGIALSVAFTIIAGSGANHPVWRAVDPDGGMWRWSIALGLGAPYAFAFVCGVLALRTHPYRDEDPASVFNACAGVAGFVLYSVLAWLMWP